MKQLYVSDLIKYLQSLEEQQGDLPLFKPFDESVTDFEDLINVEVGLDDEVVATFY